MMKKKRKDEAVSPVIGVILMVAITVILATVVSSFVFGLGTKIGSAPQAQIILKDHEDAISTTGTRDWILYISHVGGDNLKCDELMIRVTNLDKSGGTATYILNWNSGGSRFEDSNGNLRLYAISGYNYGDEYYIRQNGLLQPGDTAALYENDNTYVDKVPARIQVQIIHKPTNTIVYSGEVVVT